MKSFFSVGNVYSYKKFPLITHYMLCVEIIENNVLFIENQKGHGVRYVKFTEIMHKIPFKLEKEFIRPKLKRQQIIQRAKKLLGTPYDLLNFNCEHFINYIITGKIQSKQVKKTILGVGGALVSLTLVSQLTSE